MLPSYFAMVRPISIARSFLNAGYFAACTVFSSVMYDLCPQSSSHVSGYVDPFGIKNVGKHTVTFKFETMESIFLR